MNLGHLRMGFQPAGQGHRVLGMALHAHFEGLETDVGQPGVEGAHCGAHDPGQQAHSILFRTHVVQMGADDGAADDHAVAGEIFGGGMDHHIASQGEGTLMIGRGEGIVHHDPGLMGVGDLHDACQIDDAQGGIGRRFRVGQYGIGMGVKGLFPGIQLPPIDPNHLDTQPGCDFIEEPIRVAI